MQLIDLHIEQIEELCQKYKVLELYVFGSILTDRFNNDSDIDMIVEFEPMDPLDYMDNYFDFKFQLEDLLERQIDLLEVQAIRNPIFKEAVDQTKTIVYDQRASKLAS